MAGDATTAAAPSSGSAVAAGAPPPPPPKPKPARVPGGSSGPPPPPAKPNKTGRPLSGIARGGPPLLPPKPRRAPAPAAAPLAEDAEDAADADGHDSGLAGAQAQVAPPPPPPKKPNPYTDVEMASDDDDGDDEFREEDEEQDDDDEEADTLMPLGPSPANMPRPPPKPVRPLSGMVKAGGSAAGGDLRPLSDVNELMEESEVDGPDADALVPLSETAEEPDDAEPDADEPAAAEAAPKPAPPKRPPPPQRSGSDASDSAPTAAAVNRSLERGLSFSRSRRSYHAGTPAANVFWGDGLFDLPDTFDHEVTDFHKTVSTLRSTLTSESAGMPELDFFNCFFHFIFLFTYLLLSAPMPAVSQRTWAFCRPAWWTPPPRSATSP